MSTRDEETTIYRKDDGTGVIVLSIEAAVCGGVYLIESINGGSRYLLIPDEHRAAVAAALCPPAASEVRLTLSRETAEWLDVILPDIDEVATLNPVSMAELTRALAAALAVAAPERT